jgi:hypothetical protein
MNPERTIEIGGRAYPLLFSTNAVYQLELKLRQDNMGTLGSFLQRVAAGQAGPVELHLLLWACMEGGRRKTGFRPIPFTLDEVGDLIDDAGGIVTLASKLSDAVAAASPDSKDDNSKNEQSAKSGTGKRSSPRRSARASESTNSGTEASANSSS